MRGKAGFHVRPSGARQAAVPALPLSASTDPRAARRGAQNSPFVYQTARRLAVAVARPLAGARATRIFAGTGACGPSLSPG